jgi:hypothetical protein
VGDQLEGLATLLLGTEETLVPIEEEAGCVLELTRMTWRR